MTRQVDYEAARVACRRIVSEAVELCEERTQQQKLVEALDDAIRYCTIESHGALLRMTREQAADDLEETEQRLSELLHEVVA